MSKKINLLDNTPNQPTKLITKNWVEINDDASGTITVAALAVGGENNNIQVVFKNCVPFTNCISEINNTQIDIAKDIDVVMSLYNLIKYSNNYSKTSRSLWQYYKDEPALNDDGTLCYFSW